MNMAAKNKGNHAIKIVVDAKIYPLEAIYGAAYVFLDKAYIRLDGDPKKKIIVLIKEKKGSGGRTAEGLRDDFLNELLNYGLRCQISKNNRKIREYIVGTALLSATWAEEKTEKETEKDWQSDPLGIAVPWEEKYGKK